MKVPRFLPTLLFACLPACSLFAGPPAAIPQDLVASSLRYPLEGGVNLLQHNVRFGPYEARRAWPGAAKSNGNGSSKS